MLKNKTVQLSIYSILYDKIPNNHILKAISNAVDFSFINPLLENSYCKNFGRPAKEPEMMVKLLILQYLYNLSDIKVIEEARLNLAYMWFLGINPEDELPDASLLTKFRNHRLKETSLDDIIKEVVRQCIVKGLIKGKGLSIDATHASANTVKKIPERLMKHIAKKIFKSVEKEVGQIPSEIDNNIPDYKAIEDHKEAKLVMNNYLKKLITQVEQKLEISTMPATQNIIAQAKEILNDPKFIVQKGVRSLIDKDARVGYKSKTNSFYGYKIEFAMIPEERIITAVEVGSGAYVDGSKFDNLYYQSKSCGLEIQEFYGDKAYFRKPILDKLESEEVEAIIPVNASTFKLDDEKFKYNKDSDQWYCEMGNFTIKKVHQQLINKKDCYRYHFNKEICCSCPRLQECAGKKAKKKVLHVGENSSQYYEHSQRVKTEEFKIKYKKRASHEWKNGEMKRFHGLDRARGYGLKSMLIQAKLTALAVNLKRIAALESFSNLLFYKLVINFKLILRISTKPMWISRQV